MAAQSQSTLHMAPKERADRPLEMEWRSCQPEERPPPWGVEREPSGESKQLDGKVRAQALRRLNYIGGHVSGIRKMAADDRYCVDILKQSYAVRKALEKLETIILEGHLRSCVVEGIRGDNAPQIIDELMQLYAHSNR